MTVEIPYHTQPTSQVALDLCVDIHQGLETAEVKQRQQVYGANEIQTQTRTGFIHKLLRQFADVMIIVLLVAAIVAAVMHEINHSIVILIIVILNALIGAVQEYRAEKALDALRKISAPESTVKRDGHIYNIVTRELVPGDIVLLEAGNIVPADLRLLDTVDLEIDESTLTGESIAVPKQIETLTESKLHIGDCSNMAYKGTHVTRGHGVGITVATASYTELGRIARLLRESSTSLTPLQQRLARFGKRLAMVILTIGLQLMVIYVPFFNNIFHTSPLSLTELVVCFVLPLFIFIAVEVEKWPVRKTCLYRTSSVES
ncbi:MAG: HAD-IC family P-type ATPase [Gammaproteobacteria bacterium]